MTGFTDDQKAAVMLLAGELCAMCGRRATVVNHRINRGAGGRLSMNRLDNACALCWHHNDIIERDADEAEEARRLGVKLRDGDPFQTPLWSPFFGLWIVLGEKDAELTPYSDRNTRPDVLL